MKNLTDLYIVQLNNTWDIENQLILASPKLTAHATHEGLRDALNAYAGETQSHKIRLEELLQHHNVQLSYERDLAFETLLQDSFSTLAFISDLNVKDAYILASIQLFVAIKSARYQTLADWATQLEDELGAELATRSLGEEKETQKTIAVLADGSVFTLGLVQKAAESGVEYKSKEEPER